MHLALRLALILLSSLPLTAPASDEPCNLRVGWEEWYPLIHQQDGRLTGSEFELLNRLASQAGCTLEFVEVPWIRALQLLKQGQLDMLYGASRTAERETFARFSQSYRQEQMVLVVRATDSAPPDELSLLAWLAERNPDGQSKRFGLILGFYYGDHLEPILRAPSRSAQRLEVRWDQQLQQMLQHWRIDGYLVEASVARAQAATGELPVRLLHIREQPTEPMHLMFSLDTPAALVERFNRAIRAQPVP